MRHHAGAVGLPNDMQIYIIQKRCTCNNPVGYRDGEADPAAEVLRVAFLLFPHGSLIGRVPAAQHDQLHAAQPMSTSEALFHCVLLAKNTGPGRRRGGGGAPSLPHGCLLG